MSTLDLSLAYTCIILRLNLFRPALSISPCRGNRSSLPVVRFRRLRRARSSGFVPPGLGPLLSPSFPCVLKGDTGWPVTIPRFNFTSPGAI